MTDDIAAIASKTDITRDQRRAEMAETTFQGGNLFQPANARELIEMANVLKQSGVMIRDFYRDNVGDCAGLIALCAPYGFNPIQVSWKTYKASKNADAPIAFEAQLVNAMINVSAPIKGKLAYEYRGEGATRRCKVTGIDRETGAELVYETPEFQQIGVKNSPLWKSDPDQQLGYSASRSWARRHFPEMLLGVYTNDEIEVDNRPMRDVTPDRESLQDRIARQKAEEVEAAPEEAEVIVDIVAMPQNGAIEGDAFDLGVDAFKSEQPYLSNPYAGPAGDQGKADDWAAGWCGAEEASR